MSKIKVIIPAYNEEKAIAHVIKEIQVKLKLLLFLTTQLIILLKWQQAGASTQKTGRVWLCLLKRNGVHFEPKIKPDIVVF
jgi:hypothetical protein